jgi:hypothetical protein
MNRHRQGYIDNCPLRNDFLEILSGAINIKNGEHTREKEVITYYIKNDSDSIDLTLHYIYYPLPYVKEIFIKDWKGGWESEQSYIHLEYWNGKWKIRKSIMKTEWIDRKQGNGTPYKESKKERLEYSTYIEKKLQSGENYTSVDNDIMKEIIQYFNDIECPDLSRKMMRNYNLSKLV